MNYLNKEGTQKLISLIKTALNGKSNTGHNHDDRYYTESEVDTKLSGKLGTNTKYAGSNSTGGDANRAVKVAPTQLSNENLNNITDYGFYFAGGNNSCTNKPSLSGSGAFGLLVERVASGYVYQELTEYTNGKQWHRVLQGTTVLYNWTVRDTNTTYDLSQYVKTSDSRLSDARKANGGTADAIKDAGDGRTLKFAYSVAGMNSTSWLGSWDGSTLKAISPDNVTAGNSKKVNGHTVGIDVPANAKFTDTNTWDALKGATTTADGSAGYAPAPTKGTANRYLRSDGTWSVPPNDNTHKTWGLSISGHTVTIVDGGSNKSVTVPDNDTNTWNALKGSTTNADGSAGYAPAPAKGAANRYLRCDGTWQVPPDTNTHKSWGLSISDHTITIVDGGTNKSVTVPDNTTQVSAISTTWMDSNLK